jgi:hypothetical protein
VSSAHMGSRLATVESLAERGTFSIDGSPFGDMDMIDRVRIRGRFYSHQAPLPAVAMVPSYWLLKKAGISPSSDEPRFLRSMCLLWAGLPYLLSLLLFYYLATQVGLSPLSSFSMTAVLAFGSSLLPFSRGLNNHIVAVPVVLAMLVCIEKARGGSATPAMMALLGLLGGALYALDPVVGALLLVSGAVLSLHRGSAMDVTWIAAGALLPILLHHWMNYRIGGTLKPFGSIPEYFAYPGSYFSRDSITGIWQYRDFRSWTHYLVGLLWGHKGLFRADLTLLFLLPALFVLFRRGGRLRPLGFVGLGVFSITLLFYSVVSNNFSGGVCSIRWFLPLIPLGYYLIAVAFHALPSAVDTFLLVGTFCAPLAFDKWEHYNSPFIDPVPGNQVLSWLSLALVLHRLVRARASASLRDLVLWLRGKSPS